MERIILMVIRSLFKIPGWFRRLFRYCKDTGFETYGDDVRYELLQEVTSNVNRAGRVRVECYGKENLPKENGYILFPNHQGLFDSLLFFETHGRPFSLVMKKETENWPLVKQIRILLQAKLMDREDLRQSMKVIRQVSEEVKQGRNYLIFAEGTRSRNGNELLPFKGGAFKSAVYAKCPIVPAAVINSFMAFDRHSIKKMTAKVCYLKPLYYEEYKDMKTKEIAQIVSDRIQQAIREHSDEQS